MNNLIRKQGIDKNGVSYTRWIRPEDANSDFGRLAGVSVPVQETSTLVNIEPFETKRILTEGKRSFTPEWQESYSSDAEYFKTTYSLSGGQEYQNGVRDGQYVEGGAIYFPNDQGELVFTSTLEGLDMARMATAPVVEQIGDRFLISYITNDYTSENGGLPKDYDGLDEDSTVVTFNVYPNWKFRGEAYVREFANNLAAESYLEHIRGGGSHAKVH